MSQDSIRPRGSFPAVGNESSVHKIPLLPLLLALVAWVVGDSRLAGFSDADVVLLSLASAMFGIYIFWVHGRGSISPPGVAGVTVVVTTGYAGIHWYMTSPDMVSLSRLGLWANFLTLAAMWILWWRRDPGREPLRLQRGPVSRAMQIAGLCALLVGLAPPLPDAYAEGMSFGGAALLIMTLVCIRGEKNPWMLPGIVALLVVWVFSRYGFDGFGRRVVAQLLIAGAMAFSGHAGKKLKIAILAFIPSGFFSLSAKGNLSVKLSMALRWTAWGPSSTHWWTSELWRGLWKKEACKAMAKHSLRPWPGQSLDHCGRISQRVLGLRSLRS